MNRWLIVFSAASLVAAGTAVGSVQMGNTELKFSGSLLRENAGTQGGLNFDSWMVSGGLGYFLSDNIEVAGVGIFGESTQKWNAANTSVRMLAREENLYAFGGQAKYHFMPESQLVPYIGGQVLWADAKVSEKYPSAPSLNWVRDKQGILWGPLAGLRYTLNEHNDVFVEYQYHIWASNIHDILEDGHAVFIGLIHQFK